MAQIKSKTENLRIKAVKALEKECDNIFKKYPVLKELSNQKLRIVCPILQAHYSVNILVHQTKPMDVIRAKFPQWYDHSLPRVDIHQSILDNETAHVGVISRFRSNYEKEFGWSCLFCSKKAKDFNSKHKCSAKNICRSCERVQVPGALVYRSTKKIYCSVKKQADINPVPCPLCNMDISTAECMQGHTSFVCKRKYKCPLCQR